MKRLRVATTNAGKLREFREMLAPLGFDVRGVDDLPGFDVVEDGDTFEANALKKAEELVRRTGDVALADDSGLMVDALGGAPGVHSARYAGVSGPDKDAANRQKLLAALESSEARTARFVCVLAYLVPGEAPRYFTGRCEGTIAREARGSGGFGYDPIFYVPQKQRTMAELSPEEKHALSHRGEAVRALVSFLKA